jgi:hypothetical protein
MQKEDMKNLDVKLLRRNKFLLQNCTQLNLATIFLLKKRKKKENERDEF